MVKTSSNGRMYKYLILVAMLYTATMLATAIVTDRVLKFGPFIEPGGILLFPLSYFFEDILAEVYGYKVARQLIWFGIIAQFFFAFMLIFTMHFPSLIMAGKESSYQIVLGPVLRFFVSITIAAIISSFANIYLICRFKVITQGKYFWLRTLGSTTFGELVFSIIALSGIFFGKMPFHQMLSLVFDAYAFKLVYGLIVVYPSALAATFLKKSEGVDVYDVNTDFNPFKLSLD